MVSDITGVWGRLGSDLDDAFQRALGTATRVVLVDFPDHGNVGDSAIWLGERAVLNRLGVVVVAAFSSFDFSRRRFQQTLADHDDAAVLVHGGGNFGGLYAHHEDLRLAAIEYAPRHRVVQLPQTVTWASPTSEQRVRLALSLREDPAIIMVRDSESFDRVRDLHCVPMLVPDAIHGLPPTLTSLHRPGTVVLGREDIERVEHAVSGNTVDWPIESGRTLGRQVRDRLARLGVLRPPLSPADRDALAQSRMTTGLGLLGGHGTVVTDRLHGMLLGLMQGSKVHAADNKHGKIRSYASTWRLEETGSLVLHQDLRAAAMAAATNPSR